MKIETINVINEGYVQCHSCFYSSLDVLSDNSNYCFNTGINKIYGEIDSGVWAISYLLSMYDCRKKDFVLFKQPEIIINNEVMSLQNFVQYSCYMDRRYPLFSTNTSVRKLITKGIRKTN